MCVLCALCVCFVCCIFPYVCEPPAALPSSSPELMTPLGWAQLPPGSTVWLFVPDSPSKGSPPGVGLATASQSHPILQTYVDICVLGCLEFSREFAIEFICSTVGWDGPWRNDRQLPRRPWMHQPRYKEVDSLLQEVIPEQYARRMLPEEFGARLVEQDLDKSACRAVAASTTVSAPKARPASLREVDY